MANLTTEPFSWSELESLGMTPHEVRRHLSSGRLRRVARGVYVAAEVSDSLELRARCAAKAMPPHAVLSDRSAAYVWGVDVHDPDERFTIPPLEFVSDAGATAARREGMLGGKRDLRPEDIVEIEGLRITSPLRTAVDVACLAGRLRAVATLDAFRRAHGLSEAQLLEMVARLKGRRGVVQLRELVPLSTPLAESIPESFTRLLIHDRGLPMPTPQVELWEGGKLICRLDLGYPQWRIGVEYFGEEWHDLDIADKEHDEARLAWLRERGWHMIVVRKHQFAGEPREQWLRELGRVIAERSQITRRRHPRGVPSGQRRRR